MRIVCKECGSEFNSEAELKESQEHCRKTRTGCEMFHAEVCLERSDEK